MEVLIQRPQLKLFAIAADGRRATRYEVQLK